MKRNLLLIASSLLLAQGVYAQQIGIEQARSRAYEFGLKNSARKGHARGQQTSESATPELVYTCHNMSDQRTCFYIFNLGNDEGYVVIGGDEVAKEVLGYSESGSFDWETAPENLKWWLNQYQVEISAAMDLPEEKRKHHAPRRGAAVADRQDVPIMLTTQWAQNDPYNDYLNSQIQYYTKERGAYYPTGCVATAAAQLMKYHERPYMGVGGAYHQMSGYEWYVDFSRSYYDWSAMLDKYDPSSSRTAIDAVSRVMYDVGIAINTTYQRGASGAEIKKLGFALIENFKYDKGIASCYRVFYTDDEWESMLYKDLSANRPVIYGGFGAVGSHCFVCDGYRAEDNAFHFNWGWGAVGNYFQISSTDIDFPFSKNQQALFNIKPGMYGNYKWEDYVPLVCGGQVFFDNPEELDRYDFVMHLTSNNKKLMSYDYDYSTGSMSMNFEWKGFVSMLCTLPIKIAIQATERTTGFTVYLGNTTAYGEKMNGYLISGIGVRADLQDLLLNGTYDLKPVSRLASKTDEDDWWDVAFYPWIEMPTITVTNAITPGEVRDLSFSLSNNWLTASEPGYISHSPGYKGQITYTSSDPSVATVSADGKVTPVSWGYTIITAEGEDYVNGTKIYNGTTQSFEVQVFQEDPIFDCNQCLYYTHTDQIFISPDYNGHVTYSTDDPNILKVDSDGTMHGVSPGLAQLFVHIEETGLFREMDIELPIIVYRNMAEIYEEPSIPNDGNVCYGDYLSLPIVDHGTLNGSVDLYFKVPGLSYDPSWKFDMEPEVKTIQKVKLGYDYTFDEPVTVELYRDYLLTDPYNIPTLTFTFRRRMGHNYTVPESGYGTLLLPFCADVPDGWEVFACPELNDQGNTAMLERVATIARNKPYIIKAAPGSSHTFTGPKAIDATSPTFTQGELMGAVITDNMSLTTSDYVLDTRDGVTAFYRYQAGDDASAYCDVFRAVIHPETTTADVIYLQLPGPWGDVNGDDRVSVGDVATLVGHLKGNTPLPFVKGNADADKNGQIDNQDVEAVRNLIIKRVNP